MLHKKNLLHIRALALVYRERERKRERASERKSERKSESESERQRDRLRMFASELRENRLSSPEDSVRVCVCVCVCVCV